MHKNIKIGIIAMLSLIFFSVGTLSCDKEDDPKNEDWDGVYDINNVVYGGTTRASLVMGQQEVPFATRDTKWYFEINPETNLCNVYLIDAQFAENMPKMQLYLYNLQYNPATQTINGTNVVPSMEEGGSITPAPRFTFGSFNAVFTDADHSGVTVNFTVNNVGYGSFTSENIIM